MKLLTKEIEGRLPAIGAQDGLGDRAIAHAKFFNPVGDGVWFALEYDPAERVFFGWAEVFRGCGELGYFSLDELESIEVGLGLGIERDIHFGQKTLAEALAERARRYAGAANE